uniref:Uncharacterized protein n=1 Tax=Anguilla anguilla TaxID=7936 RepID=A0A0E9Q7V4_ANGAN
MGVMFSCLHTFGNVVYLSHLSVRHCSISAIFLMYFVSTLTCLFCSSSFPLQ